MFVTDQAVHQPGACMFCGSDHGPFVDTMLTADDLPQYGHLYLCADTVSDMAQKFGFAPPETARRYRERMAELESIVAHQGDVIAALRSAVSSLNAGAMVGVPMEIVPPGSVDEVIAWVSEGANPEARARQATVAELHEDRPRQELIEALQLLLPQEA